MSKDKKRNDKAGHETFEERYKGRPVFTQATEESSKSSPRTKGRGQPNVRFYSLKQ